MGNSCGYLGYSPVLKILLKKVKRVYGKMSTTLCELLGVHNVCFTVLKNTCMCFLAQNKEYQSLGSALMLCFNTVQLG